MKDHAIDIPSLATTRAALRTMAANPPQKMGYNISQAIVSELYAEIREAKIAGYTWVAIRDAIQKNCGFRMAPNTLSRSFGIVDRAWEKETKVPSLPNRSSNPNGRKGKKREAA